jgi:CheY-like chemotaxis protein
VRKRRRILLVEDDVGIGDAVAEFLADEGYEVSCARDGGEALALLESDAPAPQLILLDLMMPGMETAEFRRRQRASSRLAHIPVVVVSADRNAEQRSRELGVEGCLPKPMSGDALLAVVRRYCGWTAGDGVGGAEAHAP